MEKNDKEGYPIEIDRKALSRCGPGIRQLLLMKEEEIVQAKREDEERMRTAIERIKEENEETEEALSIDSGSLSTFRCYPHPVFGPVIFDETKKIPVKIQAIVDFAGNSDDLKGMGIEVHSHVQNIFTIIATQQQLATLASQAATQRISLPRLFLPTLKDAVPTAEIDQIHAVNHEGEGVIVGIVDTTLDVTHPAFRDPKSPHKTRVKFLWVQTPDKGPGGADPPGQTPKEYSKTHPSAPNFEDFPYGRIYDAGAIDKAINKVLTSGSAYGTGSDQIAKKPGIEEHGTHVAAIAAGSGHKANWVVGDNVGAAPLADIVYVCFDMSIGSIKSGLWETNAIDALNFILKIADDAGKPVVINNSYGTNLGPHNGNTKCDESRNAMLDSHKGRSLVFAAGNDNDNEGFSKGEIPAGKTVSFGMERNTEWDSWLEIWYDGPGLKFKMDSGTYSTGWKTYPEQVIDKGTDWCVEVSCDEEKKSKMKNIRLYIRPSPNFINTQPISKNWKIYLENKSTAKVKYWAWTAPQGWHASLDNYQQGEMTLQDTGCCRAILSVGACNKPAGKNPEMIANYSARGPTLDGRIKPDIVAVGTSVVSANSLTNGNYVAKNGTSMSAPLVAGAVGLLLENDPDLIQDTIKKLLTENADRKGLKIDPKKVPYNKKEHYGYGNGRLRMLTPFEQSFPIVDVDVWVKTAPKDFGDESYKGDCFCQAPEVEIFDPNGKKTTILTWDKEHKVQVRVHNRGQTPAMKTEVSLKYTRPETAPTTWTLCTDSLNQSVDEEVNIPALGYVDVVFSRRWVPKKKELPPGGEGWGDHYCLLIELRHDDDPLKYDEKTADPWTKNIKGTNNVALRNVHIH